MAPVAPQVPNPRPASPWIVVGSEYERKVLYGLTVADWHFATPGWREGARVVPGCRLRRLRSERVIAMRIMLHKPARARRRRTKSTAPSLLRSGDVKIPRRATPRRTMRLCWRLGQTTRGDGRQFMSRLNAGCDTRRDRNAAAARTDEQPWGGPAIPVSGGRVFGRQSAAVNCAQAARDHNDRLAVHIGIRE
jgi:hypothetical protein